MHRTRSLLAGIEDGGSATKWVDPRHIVFCVESYSKDHLIVLKRSLKKELLELTR